METLLGIEGLTKSYADQREHLASEVKSLERKIEDMKDRHLPQIKHALAKAREAEARLKAAIEESPELFKRPKTHVFHGVKVGFQKSKGTISWEDSASVVRLIHRHYPEQAELLIRTAESPNKQALAELPAQELKRLGVTVEETGEAVVIKPVDSDVDKIVSALLKNETEAKEVA